MHCAVMDDYELRLGLLSLNVLQQYTVYSAVWHLSLPSLFYGTADRSAYVQWMVGQWEQKKKKFWIKKAYTYLQSS